MLKKYTGLYIGLNLLTYFSFRLWYFSLSIIGSWFGFLMDVSILFLAIGYIVLFTVEKDYKLSHRYLTCLLNAIISYIVFIFTQGTSFLDYSPTSLSDGLGFAIIYVFFVFYINVGVPALIFLITVIKSIIYLVKRRKINKDIASSV